MKCLLKISVSVFLSIVLFSSGICEKAESNFPWITTFQYVDGWSGDKVIWLTSDGLAGFADLGEPTLPCRFELTDRVKELVINNINQSIQTIQPMGPKEEYSCNDETRVTIQIRHNPDEDGTLGHSRRMSLDPECNMMVVDEDLLNAARVLFYGVDDLPESCKITPVDELTAPELPDLSLDK